MVVIEFVHGERIRLLVASQQTFPTKALDWPSEKAATPAMDIASFMVAGHAITSSVSENNWNDEELLELMYI
jgi:hypothetical protein